jgi:hypothetical protein
MKSFVSAVALGFGLLFFGPATSDAQAQHFGPRVEFRGQLPLPHGSIGVQVSNAGHHGSRYGRHSRNRPYFRHHSRPYSGRSYYRDHRPYRLVRVLVYDPYPRYIHRRVYDSPRIAGGYCRQY